jgi:Spore germination protein.
MASILMITSGYACYLGIENLSRAATTILSMFIVFFIFEWILLFSMPDTLNFNNLRPMLEHGVVAVIKDGWKLITFPYGEVVLSTMFFPFVVEVTKVKKASIMAIILLGINLTINTIMFIVVLGVDFAATSLFPLLQTLRIMKIGDTFDRLDIFIILIMITGGFIKISLFTYGAMLGTAQLTKIKDTKYLAIPISSIVLITSLLIAKNYPQHIFIGQVLTLTYVHLPLAVIIPILVLIVYKIKSKYF